MFKKYFLLLLTASCLFQSNMYAEDAKKNNKVKKEVAPAPAEKAPEATSATSADTSNKKVVSFTIEPFLSVGNNIVSEKGYYNTTAVPSTSVGLASEFRLWDILAFRLDGELQSEYNFSDNLDNAYLFSFNMSAGMRMYAWKSFFLGAGATGEMAYFATKTNGDSQGGGWPGAGNWYAELGGDIPINEHSYIGFFLRYYFIGISEHNNYYNELNKDIPIRDHDHDDHDDKDGYNNLFALYVSYGYKF